MSSYVLMLCVNEIGYQYTLSGHMDFLQMYSKAGQEIVRENNKLTNI